MTGAVLDGNSHVLTLELTDAGTVGVTLLGCDCRIAGNGVRIHDVGNNGSARRSIGSRLMQRSGRRD